MVKSSEILIVYDLGNSNVMNKRSAFTGGKPDHLIYSLTAVLL